MPRLRVSLACFLVDLEVILQLVPFQLVFAQLDQRILALRLQLLVEPFLLALIEVVPGETMLVWLLLVLKPTDLQILALRLQLLFVPFLLVSVEADLAVIVLVWPLVEDRRHQVLHDQKKRIKS